MARAVAGQRNRWPIPGGSLVRCLCAFALDAARADFGERRQRHGADALLQSGGPYWPSWHEGARKLERDSALAHRPVSEAGDKLAAGLGDPYAEELWLAHLRLHTLGRLRLAWPKSDLARRDPKALRFVVLLLIVLGVAVAGSDWNRRLGAAFAPSAGAGATLDAWIDPPLYTGLPPIYLAKDGPRSLSVPEGSVLNLRVHGADHVPSASIGATRIRRRGRRIFRKYPHHTRRHRSHSRRWTYHRTLDHRGHRGPRTDDRLCRPPSATQQGALKLSYQASDDYGIAAARAIIRPHGRSGTPIILDLQAPAGVAKTGTENVFRDLTEHPYAGLEVDISLVATDAAGQTGTSKTVSFTLPARVFTDPLARALVEQRQALASIGVKSRPRVLRTLDALAIAPDQFYDGQSASYLALRTAFWGLKFAERGEDLERIQDLLWQTAVGLERGGLLNMAQQLRRMQQALTQMMAQGAPQSQIDALLQSYNDLLARYLQALAQNAPQNSAPSTPMPKYWAIRTLPPCSKPSRNCRRAATG